MQTFTTTSDYITQTIAPALGYQTADDQTDQYDMEAIAADMTTFQDGQLVERDDADFWETVQKHAN